MALTRLLPIVLLSISSVQSIQICDQGLCEFTFEIGRFRTMTYYTGEQTYNVQLNGTKLQAAENSYRLRLDDPIIGADLNPDDVITADGYLRDVITINDKFPGPDMHVISGAQVVVHVYNRLTFEATTIHWHGVHQLDTPWMDGVPYITQCPILPRQRFTYRFMASPHGTHWYHAHLGSQRLDGLYGMLIIYPAIPTTPEFVFTVNDWLHHDAVMYDYQNPVGPYKVGTGEMLVDIRKRDFILDNNHVTLVQFYGALINGRGRWNDDPYPLTHFNVNQGQKYRFRVASTGVEYSFEISVDGHPMEVVALDGNEIEPISVDSFMINTGETVDFEVMMDQTPDRYWIRAVTLRHGVGPEPKPDGVVKGVKAILAYDGSATTGDPTSSALTCDASSTCRVFGCPYGVGPSHLYKICVGLEDTKSTSNPLHLAEEYGLNDPDNEVIEYFYNFAFSIGSAVNARKYINSRAPLYRDDISQYTIPCDKPVCTAEGCRCTHVDELPYNKTIQLVLINLTPGADFMAHHVIHLHGHDFAVLKVGYAEHNTTTGLWTLPNEDIECYSDNMKICTKSRWTNQRPSLNKNNPPVKNNVLVPSRGYVVIRFRTTNPGFWMFHCHMEQHFIDGMAMVFNEAPGHHPDLPVDFPDCRDFSWSNDEFSQYVAAAKQTRISGREHQQAEPSPEDKSKESSTDDDQEPTPEPAPGNIVLDLPTAIGVSFGFILLGAFLPLVAIALHVCCAARRDSASLK